ncbi:Sjogren's syndrome/scleroderma autoantigen 1 family protein, partial [Haloferax volcanii]|uniref:Sjogren's syndrome/scleroderma autoantigen 1 family protein n=1 Tax=Haloferax volcanii TaxID=2246 RepID=UPI0028F42950
MSDFDKEAERQRLREKYERDETKRRSTQRMSELLLKGATMTNKHCDNCGDPLFRYEGQVFCPTCQAEGQAAANADQDAEQAAEAAIEADESEAEAEANANETAASAGRSESARRDRPSRACLRPTG